MSLSLQRLRYFHAIANNRSITEAARLLNIAQPALSYQLAAIERELGTKLLHRTNKGVTLTPAGAILLKRTESIFRDIEDTENEIRETVRQPHGSVTVALAVTMARQIVPPLLRTLDRKYPLVQLKILDVPSVPAIELMKLAKADVALVPNAAEMANCTAAPAYQEKLCYIIKSKGRKRNNRPIRFDALSDRPLVISGRTYDLRKRVDDAAISSGAVLNVRYEQESQEIVRAIVLAGLAGTITQASLFDPESERAHLDIRPITEPEITRTHAIVWRADQAPTLSQEAVVDALKQAISELVGNRVFPGRIVLAR